MAFGLPMAPYMVLQPVSVAKDPVNAVKPAAAMETPALATGIQSDVVELNRPVVQPPQASAGVYGGLQNHGIQRFLPIASSRPLTPQEQSAVAQGLKQWWPKIGAGYITPIPKLLASPLKSSVLSGGLGGAFSSAMLKGEEEALTHANAPLAALGALLFGAMGFISRRQSNENILDLMRRLPEGSTKRDLLSDPVYQEELRRKAEARRSGGSFDLVDLLFLLADCQGNRKSGSFRGSRVRLSRAGGRSGGGHSGGH